LQCVAACLPAMAVLHMEQSHLLSHIGVIQVLRNSLISCLKSNQIAIKHSANIYFFVQITNWAASRIFSSFCAACSRSCCACNLCIMSNIIHTPCMSMCDSQCGTACLPVTVAACQRVTVMQYECGLLQYMSVARVIHIVLQHVHH